MADGKDKLRPEWHFRILKATLLTGALLIVLSFVFIKSQYAFPICITGVLMVSFSNAIGQKWFEEL